MTAPKYRIRRLCRRMEGVGEGWYAEIGAVVKTNTGEVPYCVAGEYICAQVGRFLGLPVPPCGLMTVPGEDTTWFASLDFNLKEDSLPPVDAKKCVDLCPGSSAGVLLFDILVANPDRNEKNLSLDRSVQPCQLSVFDHGHALFGNLAGKGEFRLRRLQNELGITDEPPTEGVVRHCLLDLVPSAKLFAPWVERIAAVPDFLIDDLCDAVVGCPITTAEAAAAKRFLKHRRSNLKSIIQAKQAQFVAVNDWSPWS
jgi:hypothetical protein